MTTWTSVATASDTWLSVGYTITYNMSYSYNSPYVSYNGNFIWPNTATSLTTWVAVL